MYRSDFTTTLVPELPKLAWLATLDLPTMRLEVLHGAAVEIGDGWVVEGVWDGEFAEGGFHRTAHFFGSGIRIEGAAVHFVPSCALVDRLLYAEQDDRLIGCNSLPLILAWLGADLDPAHDYHQEARAILRGVQDYSRDFRVQHPLGHIGQLYHDRLVATRDRRTFSPPPAPPHLESYEQYRGLLGGVLERIRDNYTAPERGYRISPFATLSTGYDSSAVTTLVREIGVREVFTYRRSRSAIPTFVSRQAALDDGSAIARALGMRVLPLEDARHSQISSDELYFLAASCASYELAFHDMARHIAAHCEAAVVFTGYHGDKVWDVRTSGDYLSEQIKRQDTSGLNLSEIRLESGFIHVALPFLFARHVREIVAISHSAEMEPWRLHTAYDRPIPRRIVEEAGVPRAAFGVRKKAVTKHYFYPFNPALREQFYRYVGEHFGWSPAFIQVYDRVNRSAYPISVAVRRTRKRLGWRGRKRKISRVLFWRGVDLDYQMHLWALETLRDRVAAVLGERRLAYPAKR